jgi:hypothetical protein
MERKLFSRIEPTEEYLLVNHIGPRIIIGYILYALYAGIRAPILNKTSSAGLFVAWPTIYPPLFFGKQNSSAANKTASFEF